MSPDDTTLPARPPSAAVEKNARRRRLLSAQDWCQRVSLENPRYKYRIQEGLQTGSLHPSIEKTILEIGYGRPASIDKRLLDALGQTGRGLTLLLRKALNEDPLAEPKKVTGPVIIDQPPQEQSQSAQPALTPRASIVPPARPSKRAQGKAVLRPGEEELT